MNKTVTALCIVVSAFVLLFCVTDFFNMGENKSETTLGPTGGDCDNRSSQSEVQTTHGCNKNHYDETTDTTEFHPLEEVKDGYVMFDADGNMTSVEGIEVENAPVEYFNLQGVRVANPENGLYIRRQGNKVEKIFLKK